MFEHFTFAAQTQVPDQTDFSPSPTDNSFPSRISNTSPSLSSGNAWQPDSIDGIAHKLSQQSLRPDAGTVRHDDEDEAPPSPDVDNSIPDFTLDEMSYLSMMRGTILIPKPFPASSHQPHSPAISHPRAGALASRRLQRQINVQMQASGSHIRDINALVQDMIVTNSQCNLHETTPRPNPSDLQGSPAARGETLLETSELDAENVQESRELVLDEDEGFSEIADEDWGVEEEMTLRRASTPSRIGKFRYRGSADCVSSINSAGRMKVRSVPRMRRRKPRPVPE